MWAVLGRQETMAFLRFFAFWAVKPQTSPYLTSSPSNSSCQHCETPRRNRLACCPDQKRQDKPTSFARAVHCICQLNSQPGPGRETLRSHRSQSLRTTAAIRSVVSKPACSSCDELPQSPSPALHGCAHAGRIARPCPSG